MKKTIAAIVTVLLAIGIGLVGVTTASAAACNPSAGVSDSCTTPYTVTTTNLTLPAGHTFQASGDTNDGNVKYIPISQYQAGQTYLNNSGWTIFNINFHIETNSNTGAALIGTNVLPFSSSLSDGGFRGTLPAAGYCIVWVQVGGFNEHFGEGGQAPLCTTIPKDASAAVSTTAATCNSPETLALGAISNATWGTVTDGTGPSTYSVTATAVAGHQFSDGTTSQVFTGALAGKSTTGCSTTPACASDITWTYTYNGTNAGTVTAKSKTQPDGTTLCSPLYIRATAWDYVLPANGSSPSWPQTLHGYNDTTVSKTGTSSYAAPLISACRQYDIYASFTGYSDLKVPTTLKGPGNPYEPNFLHGVLVAPAGPNPTYSDDASTPCNVVKPAAVLVAGQCYWDASQQGSFKTVSFEFNNNASNVPVTFTVDGYPQYTTTVAAGDVTYVSAPASWTGGVNYTVYANGDKTKPIYLSVPAYADCAPTVTACTTTVSTIASTNLAINGWDYTETRANGHYSYVSGALHIWTDGTSDVDKGLNSDKSAGYYYPGTAIPLSQIGTPSMSYSSNSGSLPGIQLVIDTNGDGIADANLVYEAGMGTNGSTLTAADTATGKWWATKDLGVNSNGAPNPSYQKSWGTLTDYLKHYPTAKIIGIGYSLGSGAQGDGKIKSISAGCDKFTFDYTAIPVTTIATVTFLDVCGTTGDQVNIPLAPVSYHYETVDNRVNGVGLVTVTAVANPGYTLDPTQQAVFSKNFQADALNNCVTVPHDPSGVNETCSATSPNPVVSGFITVTKVDHVSYTIHNEADGASTTNDLTVTDGDTKVAIGTYDVTAVADAGYTLTNSPATTKVTIIKDTTNCQLPDHASFTPAATGVDPVCSNGVTTTGYIQITLGDGLNYSVNGKQLTAAQTAFGPGTYDVTAALVNPVGNTITGTNPVQVIINAVSTTCSNLKTLAFTGGGGPSGILIGSAILLLLGGVLIFTRRTPEGRHSA